VVGFGLMMTAVIGTFRVARQARRWARFAAGVVGVVPQIAPWALTASLTLADSVHHVPREAA
jgi:hypothetical protein